MSKPFIKLAGFAVAIGLLGFLPFLLLSKSRLMSSPPILQLETFYAMAANSVRQSPAATILEVDLSSRQVVLYQGEQQLKTYPIAIGQEGWETPTGTFRVDRLIQNPNWIHPFTDELIPADDPRNPLGGYWIGFWSDGRNAIGFHGTPDPKSIGSATSHGCLRMYKHDIQELFQLVKTNTVVTVKR